MVHNTIREKNKKWMMVCFFFLLMIGLLLLASPVLADVGNNNRYDEPSSSGSYDYDDGGSIAWLIWILFDAFGPIPGLILMIVISAIYFSLRKNGSVTRLKREVGSLDEDSENDRRNRTLVAEQVREIDPAFSEEVFVSWVREVFIKLQQAWSKRDWKIIRPFENNQLFQLHEAQLQEYIDNNKINKIEKINIPYCALKEFRQDGDKELMIVELHAIMRDYVIDATSKMVLESSPNKDWHMKYIMTFERKAGVKTKPGTSNKSTTNCPNCGAVTDITSSGQCKYCDSVITTGEHDWVLSDIRSIRS